jgi:hypothetical protein
MKVIHYSLGALVLAVGLTAATPSVLNAAAGAGWHQDYPAPYGGGLRELVNRTQDDLRAAEQLEHGNMKQHDRYKDAQGHLSTFDRDLTKGKFGKGELEKSIHSIKEILDNNVLQASSRDALLRDLSDLKMARDRRY